MRHTMGSLAVLAGGGVNVIGGGDVVGGAGLASKATWTWCKRVWASARATAAEVLRAVAERLEPMPVGVPVAEERLERFTASPGFEGIVFPDKLGGALAEACEAVEDVPLMPELSTLDVPLTSLTVKELRSYCRDCGVKVTVRMRKAQLVAALVGRAA
jgi:hypothetical protein